MSNDTYDPVEDPANYLDWGTEGKPPFILLHGGAQTAHSWDDFAPEVRGDHHVYALGDF